MRAYGGLSIRTIFPTYSVAVTLYGYEFGLLSFGLQSFSQYMRDPCYDEHVVTRPLENDYVVNLQLRERHLLIGNSCTYLDCRFHAWAHDLSARERSEHTLFL